MHERRNLILVLATLAVFGWVCVAWFGVLSADAPLLWVQRILSLLLFVALGGWLIYALKFETKLPDHMRERAGPICYAANGVDFLPVIRTRGKQAELCVYYQNRHENQAAVIVHIRPPDDGFLIEPGMRDVHFAFRAGGGDFGMIRQPIGVPHHLQGELLEVLIAADSHFPRSQGALLCPELGMPCGTMEVDWAGSAFRMGVHEVSGEIDLRSPAHVRLSMPVDVNADFVSSGEWNQECIEAGPRV